MQLSHKGDPRHSSIVHAIGIRLLIVVSLSYLGCSTSNCIDGPNTICVDNDPVWGDDVRLHEVLRIGQLEGSSEYTLGSVSTLAVGHDGSIFVYDAAVTTISRYDSNGTWISNVGREGSGPGEYRGVSFLGTLHDGRIVVWDGLLARISFYDDNGQFIDSFQVPMPPGYHGRGTFALDTLDNFYIMDWDPPSADGGEIPKFFTKVSVNGQIIDTIMLPPEDIVGPSFALVTKEGWRYPYYHSTMWAVSQFGYLVVGRNTEYAFELRLTSEPPRRIARAYDPVQLTREERDDWQARIESMRERLGHSGGPAVMTLTDGVTSTDLPEYKPPYRDLSTDDNGRIWVERYVPALNLPVRVGSPDSSLREPPTFDVIDPDGIFYGTIQLPPATIIHVRRDDQLWCVQLGEFDEPYVVRYRIAGSG